MISSVYWEWDLLIKSLRLGICLGVLYDTTEIFRIIIPHSGFMRNLEDGLYWIIATPAIFNLLQKESQGVFRGFSIAGILIAMFLYHKILARPWILWMESKMAVVKRRLTKRGKVLKIKEEGQRNILIFHRRNNGKEKNSSAKEKSKPLRNADGFDGSPCDDACGSSE